MQFEEALVARIRSDAGVLAVAGVVTIDQGTRPAIDWLDRRSDSDSAFPAATLQVVALVGEYDQDGRGRLEQPRVRVTSWGRTYLEARQIHRALRLAFELPITVAGVRFHRGKLLLERDLPAEKLNDKINIYRIAADYRVPATVGE